jgi:hydrogenase maturation protease
MTRPRIIGLGSPHGDDQAGWLIVDCLRERGYPLSLLRKASHPADLLDDLSSAGPLLICDACEGTGDAGAIHHWQWPDEALQTRCSGGTHNLPLAHVLELANQLADHRLAATVWGVSGSQWVPASSPSRAVQEAARDVAARIWRRYGA